MIVETGRFGQLTVGNDESISIPQGVLGFPELTKFCLVDPGDETLILWLQSLQDPKIAFPVLEPKIFRPDYAARLSSAELRELKLENVNQSAVFAILTIPEGNHRSIGAHVKCSAVNPFSRKQPRRSSGALVQITTISSYDADDCLTVGTATEAHVRAYGDFEATEEITCA